MKINSVNKDLLNSFADFIVERQLVWYKRNTLKEPPPWSEDPILVKGHFTNIYRETDKTTISFVNMFKRINSGDEYTDRLLSVFNLFCAHFYNDNVVIDKFFPIRSSLLSAVGKNEVDYQVDINSVKYLLVLLNEHRKTNRVFTTAILPPKHSPNKSTIDSLLDYCENYLEVSKALLSSYSCLESSKLLWDCITKATCVGSFRGYEIFIYLTYFPWFPWNEDSLIVLGPGTVETLDRMCGHHELSYGDCWDLRNMVFDLLIDKGFKFLDGNGKIAESISTSKFTLRCLEGSLCEYRKYLKIKESGRVLRPYSTFGTVKF